MQPGERVANRYRLEQLAGRGGMGAVFRALDERDGARVAIKLSFGREHAVARQLLVEAEVLRLVESPAVVGYRDHGHHDGWGYLVLEWLEGEDLDRRLGRERPTIGESLALIATTARALEELHAAAIVHADLKPANLFLMAGRFDRLKVIDLGAARSQRLTTQLVTMGTPHYMAPEQAAGDRELDERTDIYGLGCVLYECLTGRPPFEAGTLLELLRAVISEPPAPPSSLREAIPAEVEELCLAMLAKNPEDRPPSASALARWLQSLERDAIPIPRERPQPLPRRARTLMGDEQSLVSVLVLRPSMAGAPTDRTIAIGEAVGELAERVADLASAHGARSESQAGASFVIIAESGNAPEARLARCALALAELAPDASLGMATGHASMTGRWPLGEAIDAATRLAAHDRAGVLVDTTTRSLLDEQFDLVTDGEAFRLRAYQPGMVRPLGDGALLGRDAELATLRELGERALRQRSAAAALVVGAAGSGKSRLVREWLRAPGGAGGTPRQLFGQADSLARGSAFGVVRAALRRALGLGERDGAFVRRQRLQRHLAALRAAEEATVAFLGVLLDLEPLTPSEALRTRWRSARRDPAVLADEIRRAFTAWLAAELDNHGGLFFVVEDLHWADAPSLRLLGQALEDLATRPLVVLATARPEREDGVGVEAPPWGNLEMVELTPLCREAAWSLVRERLGPDADEALVARVVHRAEGNPFFLGELARATADGQVTSPDTVLTVARRQFDRLSADARRVLRAASVYGENFWAQGLAALLGARVAALIDDIFAELVSAEIIERRPGLDLGGEPGWGFRHALLRDAAYASLSAEARPIAHRLAATWLEERGVDEPSRLAEHWRLSDRREDAPKWYRLAAERALQGCDYAGVLSAVDHGLSLGATGEVRGHLLLAAAEAYEWHGLMTDRDQRASEALTLFSPGSPPWYRAFTHVLVARGRNQGASAIATLGDALLALRGTDHPSPDEVIALARVAEVFYRSGAGNRGASLLALAEERASRLEPPSDKVEGFLSWARAWRALSGGDVKGAYEHDAAAAHAFERAAEIRMSCYARANVGYEEMRLGLLEDACASFESANDTAERLGLTTVGAMARHNLGLVYDWLGRPEDALAMEETAAHDFENLDHSRLVSACYEYLSRIHLGAGRIQQAAAAAEHAASHGQPWPDMVLLNRATLGRALLRLDRTAEALEHTAAAMEACRGAGSADGEQVYIAVARLEALVAAGELTEARELHRWASGELERQAAGLGPLRDGFLERVPEHRRLREIGASLDAGG